MITKVRFFNPGLGYRKIKMEIDAAIRRILTEGELILRADVEKFEESLAKYCGTKYAVGLNSGTDALYLSLWALGIKPGDKVLVPSHTFVATAQVVAQLGAIPVLYDMGATITLEPDIKAIMVAHIAGEFMSTDMQGVVAWARSAGVPVIEDACQALGAVQNGKKAGSFGVTGCFSFYPAKILGAYGDAGGLVTNDEALYKEIIELRNHYKKDYSKWGINSRLDNIQAAILNVKFKHHPTALLKREMVAEKYKEIIVGLPSGCVELPKYVEGRVWQDYVIRTTQRDALYNFLKGKGIETMKNEYPFPIPKGPISIAYEAETLRLPCNEHLTDKEIKCVIDTIKEFYATGK